MTTESNQTINSLIIEHPNLATMLNTLEGYGVKLEGINEEGKLQFKYNPKDEFHDFMKRQRTAQHLKNLTGFEVVFVIA
jgi:hypothetical protein